MTKLAKWLWIGGGIVLLIVILQFLPTLSPDPDSSNAPTSSENEEVEYEVKEVASGLTVPWSIAFTDEDRLLVTERPGRLRVIENGELQPNALHTFADVAVTGEAGLMGLAIDPRYRQNKFIYLSYTYRSDATVYLKVVRFRDEGSSLSEEKVLLDRLPAASNHAGSRIKFGPDGKLYITTGDATQRSIAQSLESLGGKILRVNSDGTIPSDNPFPNSPIWSYGHRNPQGIDWHPDAKDLFASEHGPSGFDGPGGGDEINLIRKGVNYGWPVVHHEESRDGMVSPLAVYTPAEAPSGLLVYSGKMFGQYKNNIFVGALRGSGILRLEIENGQVISRTKLADVSVGRVREMIEGPDGAIYFSTSNRDGRGTARAGDDHIYKLDAK